MNASEMMTANPVTIHQDKAIHDAVHAMVQIGCHHLPVLSDEGHVVGMITDSDCRRVRLSPFTPRKDTKAPLVRDFMSPAPIIIEPDTSVDEAARLMLTNHVSCLPVMRGETLVGIITTSDMLMAFIRLQRLMDNRVTNH